MIVLLLFFTVILHNMVTFFHSHIHTLVMITMNRGEAKQNRKKLYAIDPLYLVAWSYSWHFNEEEAENTFNIL